MKSWRKVLRSHSTYGIIERRDIYATKSVYRYLTHFYFGINWDENMRNVNISIDYYLTKNNNKNVVLRISECTNFTYQLRGRNLDDIWSNVTIFSLNIKEIGQNKFSIEFYGMYSSPGS